MAVNIYTNLPSRDVQFAPTVQRDPYQMYAYIGAQQQQRRDKMYEDMADLDLELSNYKGDDAAAAALYKGFHNDIMDLAEGMKNYEVSTDEGLRRIAELNARKNAVNAQGGEGYAFSERNKDWIAGETNITNASKGHAGKEAFWRKDHEIQASKFPNAISAEGEVMHLPEYAPETHMTHQDIEKRMVDHMLRKGSVHINDEQFKMVKFYADTGNYKEARNYLIKEGALEGATYEKIFEGEYGMLSGDPALHKSLQDEVMVQRYEDQKARAIQQDMPINEEALIKDAREFAESDYGQYLVDQSLRQKIGGMATLAESTTKGAGTAQESREYTTGSGSGSKKEKRDVYTIAALESEIQYTDADKYKVIKNAMNTDREKLDAYEKKLVENGGTFDTTAEYDDYERTKRSYAVNKNHHEKNVNEFISSDNVEARQLVKEAAAKIFSAIDERNLFFDEWEASQMNDPSIEPFLQDLTKIMLAADDPETTDWLNANISRRLESLASDITGVRPAGMTDEEWENRKKEIKLGESEDAQTFQVPPNIANIVESIKKVYGDKLGELYQATASPKKDVYRSITDRMMDPATGKSSNYVGPASNYGSHIKEMTNIEPNAFMVSDSGETLKKYFDDEIMTTDYATIGNPTDPESGWNYEIIPIEREAGMPVQFKVKLSAYALSDNHPGSAAATAFNQKHKTGLEFLIQPTRSNEGEIRNAEDTFLAELQERANNSTDPKVRSNIQREVDYMKAVRHYGNKFSKVMTAQHLGFQYDEDAVEGKDPSKSIFIEDGNYKGQSGEYAVRRGADKHYKAGAIEKPDGTLLKTSVKTPNYELIFTPHGGEPQVVPYTSNVETQQSQNVEELMLQLYRAATGRGLGK